MFTTARQAAILAVLMGTFGSNRVQAGEPACSSPAVEADGDVGARWPDLFERIRGALDGRSDVDPCARVTISLAPTGIVVVVVLPDGRRASRLVSRTDDVVPTLEALLLLPRSDAVVPDARPVRETNVPVRPVAPAGPVVSARPAPAPGEPGRLRLEFSLIAGGRAGDGQVGFNLGALTLFDIAGWLVGFEAAASGYRDASGSDAASALSAAIVAGRRVWFHDLALDFTAGPALAARGLGSTTVARMADGTGAMPPPVDDGPWARLVCGARVTFRARSVVRTFAGLDGELALGRQAADVSAAPPRLPMWTVGVVVGATVGTR